MRLRARRPSRLFQATLATLVAMPLALCLAGVGARAQSSVTATDVQRLRDDVFEASTDLSRLRTGDAILLKTLRANLDALRARVTGLEEKLKSGREVLRADYVSLRDEIQTVRLTARSELTVTGAGLGPSAAAPEPSSIPSVHLEIPKRTRIDVRLLGSVNPSLARVDDRIEAATVRDLSVAGRVVVPAGSLMRGVVRAERALGARRAVSVRFDSVTVDYRTHAIAATTVRDVQRTLPAGAVVGVGFE